MNKSGDMKTIPKLNKDWHLAHRMPKNATIAQRIAWHLEHQANCSCRDIPEKLKQEIAKGHYSTPSAEATTD